MMENEDRLTGEIVTYDPIRRKGFMKIVEPYSKGRVHFTLSHLPFELRGPIIELSRGLKRRKGDGADDPFAEIKSRLKGRKFTFETEYRPNGKLAILRDTVRTAEAGRIPV